MRTFEVGFRLTGILLAAGWSAEAKAASVMTGIDVLADEGFTRLRGKRVGLLSNPTGVNRRGEPTWKVLRQAPGTRLVALFGAEHGFDGTKSAGIETPDSVEPSTGLPIYSLYGPGPVRRPTPAMLKDIDVLVYDIQDTGCRSYTYISTLGLAMEACAASGVAVMVLDRPNPLGGRRVEGPGLDPRFRSLVGQWPMPYVYGLTPGEVARMINGELWISNRCQLSVVPMKGWHRSMTWKETGLRWIASSPNVPSGESPLYLVATGMLGEIGGVNLGTGTPLSFQIIASSWLESATLTRQLNSYRLPGIQFSPFDFDFNRKASDGRELRGSRIRFTQPATAPLVAVNLYALESIKKTTGRDLFRQAQERGKSWGMFDKVSGSDRLRLALQSGKSAREIAASWRPGEDAFRKRRTPYLLYPESPSPPAKGKKPKP
ncbi:MAG: DUF1343 domain-containing protein [Verrucomicrobiales bacterium]|nr:DUF1343 domain-containing protein [Verrucomicrobiales bacterium]